MNMTSRHYGIILVVKKIQSLVSFLANDFSIYTVLVSTVFTLFILVFTARAYAMVVLGVVILFVCHTRGL